MRCLVKLFDFFLLVGYVVILLLLFSVLLVLVYVGGLLAY